jgi:hypothetical protein
VNEAFRSVEYNDPKSLAELKSERLLHLPITPPLSVVTDLHDSIESSHRQASMEKVMHWCLRSMQASANYAGDIFGHTR